MRLLLDEHYDSEIAGQLRSRGHDVSAVGERPELAGRDDRAVLAVAVAERRAVVTENARDFAVLGREALLEGAEHHGLVLVSPRAFPRSKRSFGSLVAALEGLLAANPADQALVNQVRWLQPVDRPGAGPHH